MYGSGYQIASTQSGFTPVFIYLRCGHKKIILISCVKIKKSRPISRTQSRGGFLSVKFILPAIFARF